MTGASERESIELELASVFEAFAAGLDVPPAHLFRLEGLMRSAVENGSVDVDWLRSCLVSQAEDKLGVEAADIYRHDEQWRLHMQMQRAPVYPTSKS